VINLLDSAAKRELRAARLNVTILTYSIIAVLALIAIALLTLFSYSWLNARIAAAQASQTNNAAQTTIYTPVRKQAADFSANLGKFQTVLQNRSNYSTALLNIAASLPSGATLTTVSLSPTFITTPLAISATTPDYSAALALKSRLSQSPIYSKVTLNSANCNPVPGKSGCDVSITTTLSQAVFTAGATE
jgi:Tfp pilus assembly protein PilN